MCRYLYLTLFSIAVMFTACDSGPRVVESESESKEEKKGSDESAVSEALERQNAVVSDEHLVEVEEVLDTDKYTYLHVIENGEKFWIAIPLSEVEPGETLAYRGGLLKKNFYSREYNRVFETLYLVSDIRRQGMGGSAVDEAMQRLQGQAEEGPLDVTPAEGSVRISELIANKEKYEGKEVQVTGKVVKINPNIMGRNWIHLQDGSGENLDLTVTTSEMIPVGHVVTMQGSIALNRDFGAGYRYDIIMEEAAIK